MDERTSVELNYDLLRSELDELRAIVSRQQEAWAAGQGQASVLSHLEGRLEAVEARQAELVTALDDTRTELIRRCVENEAALELALEELERLGEAHRTSQEDLTTFGDRLIELKELAEGTLEDTEARLEGHGQAIEQLQADLIETREGLGERMAEAQDRIELTLQDAQAALDEHRDLTRTFEERLAVEQQVRKEALEAMGATARGVRDRVDELDASYRGAFEQQEERWLFNAEQMHAVEAQLLGIHEALDHHQQVMDRIEAEIGQKLEEAQAGLMVEIEGLRTTLSHLEEALEATHLALGGQATRLNELADRLAEQTAADQEAHEQFETQLAALGSQRSTLLGELDERLAGVSTPLRDDLERQGSAIEQLASQAQLMAQALESVQKSSIEAEQQTGHWLREQLTVMRLAQESVVRRWEDNLVGLREAQLSCQQGLAEIARIVSDGQLEGQEAKAALHSLRESHHQLAHRVNGIIQVLLKSTRPGAGAPPKA